MNEDEAQIKKAKENFRKMFFIFFFFFLLMEISHASMEALPNELWSMILVAARLPPKSLLLVALTSRCSPFVFHFLAI